MLYYSIYLPSYYIFSNIYFQLGKLHLQITFICLLVCSISTASSPVSEGFNSVLTKLANLEPPLKTIVIDAGHGGKDSGCLGKHSQEKHIALDIALLLGEKIKSEFPEIKVIYTRTEDVFIPLHLRAKVANKNNADLFISIHCNAFSNSNIRGTETYVMGLHKAAENLETAKRENAALQYEDNYDPEYDDFDPESPEGHIFLSMYQNENLDNSIAIAAEIEKAFSNSELSKSRGVKQAGFYVLRKATMPSILVETGYLTNTTDEKFLRSNQGKEKIVNAIINGLGRYIDSRQNTAVVTHTVQDAYSFREEGNNVQAAQEKALTVKKKKKSARVIEKKPSYTTSPPPSTKGIYTHAPARNAPKPMVRQNQQTTTAMPESGIFTHAPAKTTNAPAKVKPKNNTTYTQVTTQNNVTRPAYTQNSSQVVRSYSGSTTSTLPRSTVKQINNGFYSIQIASTRELCNPIKNMGLENIPYTSFYEAGLYKYISGHFTNMQEALDYKLDLIKKGVKGAFLVKYDDNITLSIEKAKEIAKQQ